MSRKVINIVEKPNKTFIIGPSGESEISYVPKNMGDFVLVRVENYNQNSPIININVPNEDEFQAGTLFANLLCRNNYNSNVTVKLNGEVIFSSVTSFFIEVGNFHGQNLVCTEYPSLNILSKSNNDIFVIYKNFFPVVLIEPVISFSGTINVNLILGEDAENEIMNNKFLYIQITDISGPSKIFKFYINGVPVEGPTISVAGFYKIQYENAYIISSLV